MRALHIFQMIDDIRLTPQSALRPHMDFPVRTEIADIFHSAAGADERVIAFGIGGIMALQIGGLSAVFELHQDHVMVFDVDDRGPRLV